MRPIILALLAATGLFTSACVQTPSDLPDIVRTQDYAAARASSVNPTGANHDSVEIPAGATVQIADLQGPGLITHCWFTLRSDSPDYLSTTILQMTWDEAPAPAVDSPWGPFFGLGHDECADVVSAPIVVMAGKASYIHYPPGLAAFQCYFPMPFRSRARITVTNRADKPITAFFCHIDYRKVRSWPHDVHYFHAAYRTELTEPAPEPDDRNRTARENYVILDAAGQGHYVGCTLHVDARPDQKGKWYEGDDMIIVDGQPLADGILGTGSEDYFGMAWGVRRWFQSPYTGTSYHRWPQGGPEMLQYGRFSLYRWHLPDPIPFKKSIRVTIEHGHNNDAANRYASVAYWYARQP
jgi:hypothetical protein